MPDPGPGQRVGEVVEVAVYHVELLDVLPDMPQRNGPVRRRPSRATTPLLSLPDMYAPIPPLAVAGSPTAPGS